MQIELVGGPHDGKVVTPNRRFAIVVTVVDKTYGRCDYRWDSKSERFVYRPTKKQKSV